MSEVYEAQQLDFVKKLWEHYERMGRHDLPWRRPDRSGQFDPYKILVSEVMLQQTQVARVVPKYQAFLTAFPDVQTLAAADLGAVLRAWQGLGYNRRAKFLWQAATVIAREGSFPNTLESLVALPGVGVNTAGAVLVYAYNLPSVFVETNIRTAYIHHFARDEQNVSDRFIRKCLQATLDRERPREFYWALMDYGAYLKTTVRNLSQSRHYTKQSAFTGSKRQIRGAVLRALAGSAQTRAQLQQVVADERLELVLAELCAEGLIRWDGSVYFL